MFIWLRAAALLLARPFAAVVLQVPVHPVEPEFVGDPPRGLGIQTEDRRRRIVTVRPLVGPVTGGIEPLLPATLWPTKKLPLRRTAMALLPFFSGMMGME